MWYITVVQIHSFKYLRFRLTRVFNSWWQGGKERENISFERLSLKGISFRRQISSQQWDSRADKLDCASSLLSCWSRPHRVSPENSICERKPWPRPSPPRSPGPASQPGGSLKKTLLTEKEKNRSGWCRRTCPKPAKPSFTSSAYLPRKLISLAAQTEIHLERRGKYRKVQTWPETIHESSRTESPCSTKSRLNQQNSLR